MNNAFVTRRQLISGAAGLGAGVLIRPATAQTEPELAAALAAYAGHQKKSRKAESSWRLPSWSTTATWYL